MGFFLVLKFILILKLLADINIKKRMLLPFNVLGFDDFLETGVFVFGRLTQTFVFNFSFDVGGGFLVFLE
jgi:hypothetical protein